MYDVGVNWCHKSLFPHVDQYVQEALEYGVTGSVGICNHPREFFRMQDFADTIPSSFDLKMTCGYHPHHAKDFRFKYLERLIQTRDTEIAAIGECGLDYVHVFSNIQDQMYAFKGQIALAQKYNKPLYCHERSAIQDVLSCLEHVSVPVFIHCLTVEREDTWEDALYKLNQYVDRGYLIGLSTFLCQEKRGRALRKALQSFGPRILDHVMVETDAPFMSPDQAPKTNSPAWTSEVVKQLAQLFRIPESQVQSQVDKNTIEFFHFPRKGSSIRNPT